MKICKILVAVDFSEASQVAVDLALRVARRFGASMELVHVGGVPDVMSSESFSAHAAGDSFMRLAKESLSLDRSRLSELKERIDGQGVDISHAVVEGATPQAICRAADEGGADLICVGTEGRKGFSRFVLGSVAERVVNLANQDVLVARKRLDGDASGFQHVLVGTDFSWASSTAVESAQNLAAPGAHIEVAHCLAESTFGHKFHGLSGRQTLEDIGLALRESMQKRGDDMIAEMSDASRASKDGALASTTAFRLIDANPKDGLAEYAKQNAVDLIVVGSHRESRIRTVLLGSVAEATVRAAHCPVYVCRQGAPDHASSQGQITKGI